MQIETAVVRDASDNTGSIHKRSPIGTWEIHSWGDGESSGTAVISAIAALQIGATLTTVPRDQLALNEAADYLMRVLGSQLKSFQQALLAD